MQLTTRRRFLGVFGAALASARTRARAAGHDMRVAVAVDEFGDDFGRAAEIARDLGFASVELRTAWSKSALVLDSSEREEVRAVLRRYGLSVCAIASPLFKVRWPEAPSSKATTTRDVYGGDFAFEEQDEVLERALELADAFGTRVVRCFDFRRVDDVAPYRADIDE